MKKITKYKNRFYFTVYQPVDKGHIYSIGDNQLLAFIQENEKSLEI